MEHNYISHHSEIHKPACKCHVLVPPFFFFLLHFKLFHSMLRRYVYFYIFHYLQLLHHVSLLIKINDVVIA